MTYIGSRLARVLDGYRLENGTYSPNIADSGDRLQTSDEWAEEIVEALFGINREAVERVTKGSNDPSEQVG